MAYSWFDRPWVLVGLPDHEDGASGRCGVPGQPSKACNPMMTGPAGSAISLKDVHPQKADSPMSVRLGGSVIAVKDVHPKKAHPAISVRLGGSVISPNDVHRRRRTLQSP